MRPEDQRADRLCAFTDGVYAIVITLLVLELKPPHVPGLDDRELIADLGEQLHTLVAYVITFVVVGGLWWRHHGTFRQGVACDDTVLLLNLAHILAVTLLPFTAALVGRYPGDGVAVLLFAASLLFSGVSLAALAARAAATSERRAVSDVASL